MFNLFYTLFKYKEKAQKDELGYYPEKVDVKAFPERRFLWTSRFFVVVSCLSLCFSMILGGILCLMIPLKKTKIMPLQIDYNRYQITRMEASESEAFAGDLVTESILAEYITKRYTIGDSLQEMQQRLGINEFVHLASSDEVYKTFMNTEYPYFEMLQKQGIRREVEMTMIYPVSFDFWQTRFNIIEKIPGREEPVVSYWIATLSIMCNLSQKIKETGIETGIEMGKREMIIKMYNKGYTAAQIADVAEMDEKKIKDIIKNAELLTSIREYPKVCVNLQTDVR